MKKIPMSFTCDADHGTEKSLREGFRLLEDFGIKVTFAAFLRIRFSLTGLGKHCNPFETGAMTQKRFFRFVEGLVEAGHEIAIHGYSQISDTRAKVERAFDFFATEFGIEKPIYIEHGGHYGFHRESMVKKESLNYLGASDPGGPFYVADLLRERSRAVWKHPLLTDHRDTPIMRMSETFFQEGGITYFWRSRAHQFLQALPSLVNDSAEPSSEDLALVGYTHFGYRGYPLTPDKPLERWDTREALEINRQFLAGLLSRGKIESLTVSELHARWAKPTEENLDISR